MRRSHSFLQTNEERCEQFRLGLSARNDRNLHLLDFILLSLQMTGDSAVRSVHAPSLQTQLLAALLSILYPIIGNKIQSFVRTYIRSVVKEKKKKDYAFLFLIAS